MAASKGNVSSVSFYVDRTCALSTIEFGAFDLINRNVEANTASLVLTHRSGLLKLGTAKKLKPYMNLITIRLCNGKSLQDTNAEDCQGAQFPVLPHQYLGVRSDTCRLGFGKPALNPAFTTTWVSQ